MPVNMPRAEYSEKIDQWIQVDDCVNDRVKSKGVVYLPMPNPTDKSPENVTRYNHYLQRALFLNVTKRTHEGFIGMVYQKDPEIKLPLQTEYLAEKANRSGLGLTQVSKKLMSYTICAGRGGVLTDFEVIEEGEEQTQSATKDKQAFLVTYKADDIVNWKTKGGELCQVVLRECYEKDQDEFTSKTEDQYRVLGLDESGRYYQVLFRKMNDEKTGKSEYVPVWGSMPTNFNGEYWNIIPFSFTGTVNNDSEIDPSLLFAISEINIGHYRNSADLEENCFIHGQLTLGITSDLSADQFKVSNPNGVQVGARSGHFLGKSGGFHAIQADPNQLAQNLQADKEKQMASIGASLLNQDAGADETVIATYAKIGADSASLLSATKNVSEAMQKAVNWAGDFMGATEEAVFKLNTNFYPKSKTPQDIIAEIQLYDRGLLARSDIHRSAQSAGIVPAERTVEDVDSENESSNPLM